MKIDIPIGESTDVYATYLFCVNVGASFTSSRSTLTVLSGLVFVMTEQD